MDTWGSGVSNSIILSRMAEILPAIRRILWSLERGRGGVVGALVEVAY